MCTLFIFSMFLVMGLALGYGFAIPQSALAQGYYSNSDSDSYNSYNSDSKYPQKYECRTGPFEGFFVSSPEFCFVKKPSKVDERPIVQKETLTVVKNTECQADAQTCQQNPIQPSNFTINIEGNNPSQTTFPGSSSGTNIQLKPGAFNVSEQGLDPIIPQICNTMGFDAGRNASSDIGQNLFICTNFSDECEGNITIGNPQTCTIYNVLVQQNVFGNKVYVVWQDNTPGRADIFFAASNDNGQTFSTPINLSNNTGTSGRPQISTEGNNVYVVWFDNTPGNIEIFFAASNDNGQTFSTPKNISNTPQPAVLSSPTFSQISSEGNNVYVVWEDLTLGNSEIFFAASNDNGQTFSTPENLSNNTGFSRNPQITSEGNNVYVVWEDKRQDGTPFGNDDIFFAASNDNGQTFSILAENISNNTGTSRFPQISAEGNNVYVVWQDITFGNNGDIFFAASNDNGQTFSTPINLSNNTGLSENPQITSEGNNVYMVWSDSTPGNRDIFFAASNDNGQTFSTLAENISNNAEDSSFPEISSEGNNVYVVWEDDTPGNPETFFAASNDNGQTFSTPKNISNTPGSTNLGLHQQQISSEGNNIYVLWRDETPSGNSDIFFAVSTDNGQIFITPPENLSNNAGESTSPKISSSTS